MTQDQATVTAPMVASTEFDAAGLTEAEAARRLAQCGENALVEHRVSVFERLTRFFWGPAIQEARRIFERMNSYAIYRIAETIRLLLFMTASILIFNFYPVTAIMVVLLAKRTTSPARNRFSTRRNISARRRTRSRKSSCREAMSACSWARAT